MDHVTLGSGTFQDISDVLAFTKFKMCIFLRRIPIPNTRSEEHWTASQQHEAGLVTGLAPGELL